LCLLKSLDKRGNNFAIGSVSSCLLCRPKFITTTPKSENNFR
jgi:hypothetical protein